MWWLESLDIIGGFLPGLKVDLPRGLTCIIGPRGSGKSTLAEFIRYAIKGQTDSTKPRAELLQTNLGSAGLLKATTAGSGDNRYTITRGYKQQAFITSTDGRQLSSIDLERGTFLPLDAYNSQEIEEIADEELGEKRRSLLDQLSAQDLRDLMLKIGEQRRALEASADNIRAQRAKISDIVERIEELGDVRARLAMLGPPAEEPTATEYAAATKQRQMNAREQKLLADLSSLVSQVDREMRATLLRLQMLADADFPQESANAMIMSTLFSTLNTNSKVLDKRGETVFKSLEQAAALVADAQAALKLRHDQQLAHLAQLAEINEAAGEAVRERASLEEQASLLDSLEKQKRAATLDLQRLIDSRKSVKAAYLDARSEISRTREHVAEKLQGEAGNKVRVRVIRNADDMAYRQKLLDALKGARVRNHEDILRALLTFRPEDLSQILVSGDYGHFEEQMRFGSERSGRIFESLKNSLDPWSLETVSIDDRILIELNVGTAAEPIYRDAADLSRGQKCTALLPLLLAQRDSPIVIDQPEDNLDNHFIFETIVDAISRLKSQRQMILITHNANIPVLADADLVIVMNSDGKVGYVEKAGTVDECRIEIIDLLEGGQTAFDLRARRYAKR